MAQNAHAIAEPGGSLAVAALLLGLCGLLIGQVVTRVINDHPLVARTIAIEVHMQNPD